MAQKRFTVGITGGMGSGKSYGCQFIEAMGYPVFYADKTAKKILNREGKVIRAVIELFGENAYINGKLNRPLVAEKIFEQPDLREAIHQLVHPLVRKHFLDWSTTQLADIVFHEAAILFETGSYRRFDYTVLICAPKELRIERIQKRDHLSRSAIESRMATQWPDEQKKLLADFVVENDGKQLILPQLQRVVEAVNDARERN